MVIVFPLFTTPAFSREIKSQRLDVEKLLEKAVSCSQESLDFLGNAINGTIEVAGQDVYPGKLLSDAGVIFFYRKSHDDTVYQLPPDINLFELNVTTVNYENSTGIIFMQYCRHHPPGFLQSKKFETLSSKKIRIKLLWWDMV